MHVHTVRTCDIVLIDWSRILFQKYSWKQKYVYLELVCPPFLGFNPPQRGSFPIKTRVVYVAGYIYVLLIQVPISSNILIHVVSSIWCDFQRSAADFPWNVWQDFVEKLLSVPPSDLLGMFSRVIFQQDVSVGCSSVCEVASEFALVNR